MKTLKYIAIVLFLILPFCVSSQESTSGGTLTINGSETGGDHKQRDEVDLVPGVTDVHITPNTGADAHLYTDPSIIIPTTYASGGANTNGLSAGQLGGTSQIDNSLPVGSIQGTYAVSNGTAIYNIPIIMPPGTNAMTPNLSLQYNSRSQKGILGEGWSLQGMSAITRVDKTLYHDGVIQAIQLNSSDALSLDGNRLIATSTPNNYVLENENFSMITYVSGSGSSGDYYKVQTRDGKTMEYGSTVNSKMQFTVSSNTITYTWYLTKMYDNYGNTILYSYNKNPTTISTLNYNELVLSKIDYTLNSNPLVSPNIPAYNSIKFDYEQRTDLQSQYVLGNLIGSTLLLRQIEVDCEGVVMKKYSFDYGKNSIGKSYLNKVIESGSDESNLNPTIISYAIAPAPAQGVGKNTPTPSLDNTKKYISGDFNGDGRADLLGLVYTNSNFSRTYATPSADNPRGQPPVNFDYTTVKYNYDNYSSCTLYTNNDNGLSFNKIDNVITLPAHTNTYYSSSFPQYPVSSLGTYNVVDINGDGMDDVIIVSKDDDNTTGNTNGSVNFTAYLSNGSGFTQQSSYKWTGDDYYNTLGSFTIVDVNGDGLPEGLLSFPGENRGPWGLNFNQFITFDLMTGNNKMIQKLIDLNGHISNSVGGGYSEQPCNGIIPVEFDGDNKSEFITSDGSFYYIKRPVYNQSGVFQSVNTLFRFSISNQTDKINVCDYNGDGISDYIIIPQDPNGHPNVYFGTGNGITAGSAISNAPGYGSLIFGQQSHYYPSDQYNEQGENVTVNQYLIADVNGDGNSDLVYIYSKDYYLVETFTNPVSTQTVVEGQQPSIAVSYGSGNVNTVNQMSAIQVIPDIYTYIPIPYDFSQPNLIPEFVIGDYDADGNTDIMIKNALNYSAGNSYWIINPYAGNVNNLATSITNGKGGYVDFTYNTISAIDNSTTPTISNNYIANPIYSRGTSSIPNYPIIQIQKPINVVSSVGLPDGIGGTNTTNYSYTDAQVHIQGGGFLGFGSITSNNSVSNTQVVNKFSTLSNVVTTGVTILEKVPTEMTTTYTQGANTFINKSTYNYSIFPLNSNNLRHFTPLVSQTDIDYTGSTTTSNYTYDNNTTNPTNDNVTEVDINVQGVETKSIINTYTTFQDFTYIPSRILTSTTKVSRPTQPDYQRETDYTYTNEGSIASIITDPTLAKKVTIAYTYFPTGNIQKQATSSSDPNTVPVNLEYTYEPKYRFKASFSNPLQQVSEYIYDSKWGAPLSQTGVDNLTTTYAYDAFGRNIRVNTPDGLTSTTSYDWATAGDKNGWNTDPIDVSQNALTKITSTKDGSPSNIVFYDLFGRQVKSITDGFNNPINMVTTYDALGNLLKQTNAFEGGGNPTHKAITTTYTYDNLSRVNNILQKDVATGNTQITSDYTYLYNSGISTIQANINTASSNPKTITKKYDATGLLIQSGDNGPVFLSYTYGGHHQPVKIDLGATSTIIDYDEYARQKSLTEANSGITAYIYNAYGQLVNKNDNSLVNLYTYAYDGLGRITTITSQGENGGTYNYQYVSSGNGINQLQKVAGPNNFDCIYSYDALNRPTQLQEDIGGLNPFITKTEYDQYNNVNKVTYPGGFAITKTFDSHGYLKKIRDNNGNNIWQTNAIDIFGNFYNYTLGNGITVQKTFSDFGYPTKFYAQGIQDYDFSFDPLTGNLGKRTDNTHNNFENFGYDNQDRLLTVSGSTSLNMIYATSGNGNISSKSDVGNYTYDPNKINAVTEVTNPSGIISSNTQTIDYNAFNKPQIIKELDVTNNFAPINELDYTYGPDQERRVANLFDATGKKISTTYYHHNYEKIVAANGTSFTETSYIGGGDGVCAMYVNDQNGNGNLYFVFRDHLGSILKVTDANGTSISEQSFDAWGKPRDPANWNSSPAQSKPSWLIRGFTGHEHLPQFSLINMNARLYDPINARVASVDNDVEDPGNTQNYNRYSYCLNNPLKYTDPTGNDATNDFLIEYIGNLFNGNEMADQNAVDDIASASSVTSYTPPAGSKNPDGFMPQYVIQPNPAGPDEPDEDPLGVLQMNYNIKLSSPMPIQNIQGGITTSPVSSIQTFAGNTASPISQLSSVPGDASGWMSNFRSAVGLTTIWATGMPVKQITFNNNTIANAFRNSSGIAQARNEYYQLGQTTGSYNFGLSGLISAGIDPMEQFVGSFDYTVTPMGNNLQYTMKNTTSFSSAAYHLWPASMNWHNGPMSNTSQTYIFSEPILKLGK